MLEAILKDCITSHNTRLHVPPPHSEEMSHRRQGTQSVTGNNINDRINNASKTDIKHVALNITFAVEDKIMTSSSTSCQDKQRKGKKPATLKEWNCDVIPYI